MRKTVPVPSAYEIQGINTKMSNHKNPLFMNKLIKISKDNALLFRRPLMVGLILGLSFPAAPLTLQAAQKTIIEISEEGNITLVVKKKSLRSVLSDIEKNSKYVFGYNSNGSPDKPGGLSIQLCKSEKKEFYIRYSS